MNRKRRISPTRLRQLWRDFTVFQEKQLAPSTIKRDYHKVSRILQKMPSHLDTSIEIRDWLLGRYALESTRRIIQQFNACCKWAVASDVLSHNPFDGVGMFLRKQSGEKNWTAFTVEERAAIIARMESDWPFYSPWVKFLFWTGCRPEEAAALQWRHINPACTSIQIREAVPVDVKIRQSTKTRKPRVFPCNDRLTALLLSLRPTGYKPDDLVFKGPNGGAFEYHNFQTRQWRPTITALVDEGQVSLYLSQYHCRHTFITLALDHLSEQDIAYLVGNSPTIIYKHYASRSRSIVIPEF